MEFYTHLTYSKPIFQFSYEDRIMLLGSCFVENMGIRMEDLKFRTDINPFGTLYNPASIASALNRLMDPVPFHEKDLFYSGGLYHSYLHHSRFSATSSELCLKQINNRLQLSADFFRQCERLIITFGTSWVYKLKETDNIVANCHKQPERIFNRERLDVASIVSTWKEVIEKIKKINPNIKILFTVSPIRHWKDGAHGNQLSKSVLLLAIDKLNQLFPDMTAYFPSYEIMMDELRDYRFYADDMLHPSAQAIDYIWQKFVEQEITEESKLIMKTCMDIKKAVEHRPFNPDSEAYRQFIMQTLLKIDQLNEKIIFFDYSKERNILKSKIK